MTRVVTGEEIEAASRALITARATNLGIEVTTPVVYPTGKCVNVVVTVEGGDYIVHDAGFGAMALTAAGVRITKDLARRLVNLAAHYGCDFIENRTTRRCTVEQLALAIAMVANASRTIGDQALDVRRRAERTFQASVRERVHAAIGDKRVRDNEEVIGKSGRHYRMAHVVLDREARAPVAFVKGAANDNAALALTGEFFDIREANPRVARASVYDDTHDWQVTNIRLLSEVSEPVKFSESEKWVRQTAAR